MARQRTQLVPYLTAEELKKHYRSCSDAKEARRLHVLWLVSQGSSLKEAAMTVGLGLSWVREVISRYNKEGLSSVKDRHSINPGGKKPRLNRKQQIELAEAIKGPPPGGGDWTGAKVADWIKHKTGVETYSQLGWVYLRALLPKRKSGKQLKVKSVAGRD
jgi:transposase